MHRNGLVFRECKHIKNIFEDVYFTKNSFHITLKCLIYYFYHLTTLKHLEDLNMMFLDYLILLLNIGYTILGMEHNSKKYYFILIKSSQMLQF